MTRSRREARNGLILGYKKAEEVARKKVVIEVSGVGFQVSGKKNKKTETSLFVIWNLYSSNNPVLQNSSQSLSAKPLNMVNSSCHSSCLECWGDEMAATV